MPAMILVLDVEETGFAAMRNLDNTEGDRLVHLGEGAHIEVGALAHGMSSGKPSAAFCFALPDGRVVLAETSLALFLMAADALKARFGDPRQ